MKNGATVAALAVAFGMAAPAGNAADYRPSHHYVAAERSYSHPLQRGYTGRLPSCADEHVHSTIAGYFVRREREYWRSGLELTAFTRPVELGYRSWGPEFIPRRFCGARTVTTDGRRREVFFVIGEGLSPGSIGWGVDWCVTGLDRNYAFAPNCKMARP